tara:strand:- start:546 stop:1337 length:792 start_codon:yes stop_codon:yes gene_type:complete
MIKKFVKKILSSFGYKLSRIESVDLPDLDEITKSLTKKPDPIIFDVGANKGQSIERYKKMFKFPTIHCFEPNADEISNLKKKFLNDNNLVLNNLAVGEKEGTLEFNINAISDHSSFRKLIPNTTWIKKRSKQVNISSENYTSKKINTEIITLDDYVKKKNIENIDILKIDTQGFEDKVLLGAQKLIKENKIKLIQLELIFSEIYQDSLQIYDIEKNLIPKNFKLFSISNGGSLDSHYIFQSELIYVSSDVYENFKKNSPYFNN